MLNASVDGDPIIKPDTRLLIVAQNRVTHACASMAYIGAALLRNTDPGWALHPAALELNLAIAATDRARAEYMVGGRHYNEFRHIIGTLAFLKSLLGFAIRRSEEPFDEKDMGYSLSESRRRIGSLIEPRVESARSEMETLCTFMEENKVGYIRTFDREYKTGKWKFGWKPFNANRPL